MRNNFLGKWQVHGWCLTVKSAKIGKPQQTLVPVTSKPGCVKLSQKVGKLSHTK